MMNFSMREIYRMKRKKKRITLKEISDHIRCHLSLISKYEIGNCEISREKIQAYRQYIDSR